MESKTLITGIIIGAVIGAALGYYMWGNQDTSTVEAQIATLQNQLDALSDQLTAAESDLEALEIQLSNQAATIQSKNVLINSLQAEITSLEQEIEDMESQIPETPEQNTVLGSWTSSETMLWQMMFTENFTITGDTLILRWAVVPGYTSDITIIVVDSETEANVEEIILEDATFGVQQYPITPGKYYIYAMGDEEYTITAMEPPS
ncbi:MAG: hypothetical protein NWF07_01095 [Candidatus Bathyarchaeota archaeon]|nr:hypothetical protein [Candidatus Bathyarchaeota archaeon]